MRSPARHLLALALAVATLVLSVAVSEDPPPPYVVTAIDYHYHDAHPTFPIALGRNLVVTNAGRNVHNVTIDSIGFSDDVAPGGRLTIEDVGTRLGGPGEYVFVCRYHQDRGMGGVIVIAGG